jgi:hypothetical protein
MSIYEKCACFHPEVRNWIKFAMSEEQAWVQLRWTACIFVLGAEFFGETSMD